MKPLEAKHLRIGNFLFENGELIRFTPRMMYSMYNTEVMSKEGFTERYKPVPLTDDWWDKFGYECLQEFLCHISEKARERMGISFDLYNNEGHEFIKSLPIHKIQNLFLELTGEELEIKQTVK